MLIILTGPAGAGKNAVATAYADLVEHCAIVDVDVVRQMLVKPHKAPWEGEEGLRQHELGISNASNVAKSFVAAGCDVLILDVAAEQQLSLYRELLLDYNPTIVLLLPSLPEVFKRNKGRQTFITENEINFLYQSQQNLISFDRKIDNTYLRPEEVARELVALHRLR